MANLNRDSINTQRKLNNQPPLTDAEWAALNGGNGDMTDAEKEALVKKAEEERLEAEKKKKEEEEANRVPDPQIVPTPLVITDDMLLQELSKRGIKASSFDDLRNKEEMDREKLLEERESEKLAWALKNKKVKQKEYENYISASKNPEALVYQLRLQVAKKEDPALSEDVFKAEFEEEFGIDQPATSRRHKNGQDTLNRMAEAILKNNFSSIYNLESDYSSFETSQKQKAAQQAKIKDGAPAYKTTIDKVFSNLKKIKTQFSEGDVYEVEVLDDSLASLKAQMSDSDWASQQILAGYSEETLTELAYTSLLRNNFPVFAGIIARQYLEKHAAGTKGIPPTGKTKKDEGEVNLSPQHEILKNLIETNKPQVPVQAN